MKEPDPTAERIKQIIADKHMNAAQFARTIIENPAKLSHIFNGRNNASTKTLNKIMTAFPEINPQWLIHGEGEMYMVNRSNNNNLQNENVQPGLFDRNYNSKSNEFTSCQHQNVNNNVNSDVNLQNRGQNVAAPAMAYVTRQSAAPSSSNPATSDDEPKKEKSRRKSNFDIPSQLIAATKNAKQIKRIIVYYDDDTYEEFSSTK